MRVLEALFDRAMHDDPNAMLEHLHFDAIRGAGVGNGYGSGNGFEEGFGYSKGDGDGSPLGRSVGVWENIGFCTAKGEIRLGETGEVDGAGGTYKTEGTPWPEAHHLALSRDIEQMPRDLLEELETGARSVARDLAITLGLRTLAEVLRGV